MAENDKDQALIYQQIGDKWGWLPKDLKENYYNKTEIDDISFAKENTITGMYFPKCTNSTIPNINLVDGYAVYNTESKKLMIYCDGAWYDTIGNLIV